MKRNWNTIRTILLHIENDMPHGFECFDDNLDIDEHLILLTEGGLIEIDERILYHFTFRIKWQGYEFLDKIRDLKIWDKVNDYIEKNNIQPDFKTLNKILDSYLEI